MTASPGIIETQEWAGPLENPGWVEAIREPTRRLLHYCRSNDWVGCDSYDALNSRVFKAPRFLDFRLARLALTQFNKRSPIG